MVSLTVRGTAGGSQVVSYNQAIAVVTTHLQSPSVELARFEKKELARLQLGYKYSYGLVLTTLDLQVTQAIGASSAWILPSVWVWG